MLASGISKYAVIHDRQDKGVQTTACKETTHKLLYHKEAKAEMVAEKELGKLLVEMGL